MLKGIPAILPAELVKLMMEMGHGDTIVIADARFPAYSVGQRVVDCSGSGAVDMLNAVLKLFPLDTYVPFNGQLMRTVKGDLDGKDPDIWQSFTSAYAQNDYEPIFETLEREEFYETARKAYAVIRTGETAPYANIILKKGNNCD